MKTVDEIYGKLAAAFAGATGQTAGQDGDMAVRLYAVAAQVYALYVQADWTARQCFPQTASGEHLDQHAFLRGLERKEAAKAVGVIRFYVDQAGGTALTIPAGTVCMTAGLVRFETTEAAVLRSGSLYVDAAAQAVEPGTAGNAAAGTILTMAVAPVGVSRCSNPEGFAGGTDREDDETLRVRVLETFRRLPNGANAAFYEQGALSFPEVAAAAVLPRSRGIGTVDVVVATAAGSPDEDLLERLTAYFQERREIAVDVQVRAPREKTVDVSVAVSAREGSDAAGVRTAVEQALGSWFNGGLLGQDVLRAKLGAVIFGVDGVENYDLTAPAADVAVEQDELPRLGSLSVTEMKI